MKEMARFWRARCKRTRVVGDECVGSHFWRVVMLNVGMSDEP